MAQVKALIGNIKGKDGKDGVTNVYNTSETVIGTYCGVPLYRRIIVKSITPTGSAGTQTVTTLSTTDISSVNVVNLYGCFYINSVGTAFPLPQIKNDTACYRRSIMMSSNGTIQFHDTINDGRTLSVIAIVEYIK